MVEYKILLFTKASIQINHNNAEYNSLKIISNKYSWKLNTWEAGLVVEVGI